MSWPDCSPALAHCEDRSLNLRADQTFRGQRWLGASVAAAVIMGLIDYWGSRFNLNPDGVSYVEMAQHALASGPGGLINGYWSPGYPALLVPALGIAGDGWGRTIPVLHVVNLVIFFAAAVVFVALLRASGPLQRAGSAGRDAGLGSYSAPFGIAAFAVIALQCIGLGLLTPDLGVMLAVLLTAFCCFQLEDPDRSWRWAATLGVVLGLGYWTKGILFPLNLLLLGALFIVPPRTERARSKVALAGAVFALVSAPLIVVLSRHVGHATTGEVGRLNYAWEIDPVSSPFVGWLGDPGGRFGTPLHPPRLLAREPETLEFATPIRATYPLWFDPSYWYAGLQPRFDLAGQQRALLQGVADLRALLLELWAIAVSLAALWLVTARGGARNDGGAGPGRSRLRLTLAAWCAAAALVYALVHVEPRYLAGFVALGVVLAWHLLVHRVARRGAPIVMGCVLAALALSLGCNLRENIGGFDPGYRPDYLIESAKLRDAGLAPGDHVAMVGDAYEVYAAFAAGTPITAQVMDSIGFWQVTAAARSLLQERLAATGVRAVLANNVAPGMRAEGWQIFSRPDSSNLGLLMLPR